MKKIFLIFFLVVVFVSNFYCQNKMIYGKVINDQLDYMPLVSIMNNKNIEIGKTDLYGFFKLEIPISTTELTFKSLGIENTTIRLTDKCNEVEIIVMLQGTYDFLSQKKVFRLRKKRFEKIPKLHIEAYKKGIFKTKSPCYIQLPISSNLQEYNRYKVTDYFHTHPNGLDMR